VFEGSRRLTGRVELRRPGTGARRPPGATLVFEPIFSVEGWAEQLAHGGDDQRTLPFNRGRPDRTAIKKLSSTGLKRSRTGVAMYRGVAPSGAARRRLGCARGPTHRLWMGVQLRCDSDQRRGNLLGTDKVPALAQAEQGGWAQVTDTRSGTVSSCGASVAATGRRIVTSRCSTDASSAPRLALPAPGPFAL